VIVVCVVGDSGVYVVGDSGVYVVGDSSNVLYVTVVCIDQCTSHSIDRRVQ